MIASDVVALFPSMGAKDTARICASLVEESLLTFENLDIKEMLLYIYLNQDKCTDISDLRGFFPRRARKGGQDPSMRNEQILAPTHQSDIEDKKRYWVHREEPQGRNGRWRQGPGGWGRERGCNKKQQSRE